MSYPKACFDGGVPDDSVAVGVPAIIKRRQSAEATASSLDTSDCDAK